jgi:undecaprenyl-diphosphatase
MVPVSRPAAFDPVMSRPYLSEFRHLETIVAVAAIGLAASYAVAVQLPVPSWELQLTEWINDVPDWVGSIAYPPMQFGTLAGPLLAAAAIVAFRRDVVLGAALVVTGVVTWFGAKLVKRVVERDRPLSYLPDILVREGDGTGLGYISGHSAVAASAATMCMVALPRRARPAVAGLALIVGFARVVHGVHLPADIVGGWSFGILLGLAGIAVADALRARLDGRQTNPRGGEHP